MSMAGPKVTTYNDLTEFNTTFDFTGTQETAPAVLVGS